MDVNRVKTWVLIAGLGGLFVLLGEVLFHGVGGLAIGLAFGLGGPPRVSWRLQPLRGWSHVTRTQVPTGGP